MGLPGKRSFSPYRQLSGCKAYKLPEYGISYFYSDLLILVVIRFISVKNHLYSGVSIDEGLQ